MNRIQKLFNQKNQDILSVYFTAGYPNLDDTVPTITGLEHNGVDLIEIGIPFSDPVADGPVIQKSSEKALHNGMSLNLLFEQLKDIRTKVKIPLIMMGYVNTVMQFGVEEFCRKCQETGIDGTILPDLPLEVYEEEYRPIFEKYGIENIFLITPQTTSERIEKIDKASSGFIYMVSSSSTTGVKSTVEDYSKDYFERIQKLALKTPRLIGFGISNKETFENACYYSSGAIIGSAFVRAVSEEGDLSQKIKTFVGKIR